MNRAARRRAEKAAKKAPPMTDGTIIHLQNPVAEHFASFIIGNAQYCDHVVEENSATGQHLVLCGAGPSLAEHADEWCATGDQLWGVNSALSWLVAHGHTPTHGITVDQTAHMVEEWHSAPDVEYLIASSVHPHLVEYLRSKDRTLRFFHNFVGVKKPPVAWPDDAGVTQTMSYEDWMYCTLYEGTVRAGSGLNSVNRAVDVALFMGFDRITVLGADCAIRFRAPHPEDAPVGSAAHAAWLTDETQMHADGGHALASGATPVTMFGTIDGREWLTKPDMVISAVYLEMTRREHAGRITLIGDTLPQVLKDKPESFLRRLPSLG